MTSKQKNKSKKVTSDIQVVKDLFTKNVHNQILDFIDNHTQFLPLKSDNETFIRQYGHNIPYISYIHHQLKDYASNMFGEKVKPSYSFLSMYKSSGQCPLHIDRDQCRYTIDYLINDSKKEEWPIRIAYPMSDDERISLIANGKTHPIEKNRIDEIINANKWTEVVLNHNDAVLYSGTHSWHYRPKKLKGFANLIFFHFVPEDFDGSLD